MPTTIHLPKGLLEKIDARAKARGLSRNRFIVQTLAEKMQVPEEWPEEFVQKLKRPVSKDVAAAADELQRIIESGRRSRKAAPKF